ncbi:MAG: hypothetical protein ABI166_13445 [Mucilaginibacter sp.]
MNKITGLLLSNAGIDITLLSSFQLEVIESYETHGFFKHTQLEQANPYLEDSLRFELKASLWTMEKELHRN